MHKLLNAIDYYREAHNFISKSVFAEELRWQSVLKFSDLSEQDFLRETAWVILCSGFREATLRKLFSTISLCFCDWESAAIITERSALCRATALDVFGNRKKIDSILAICAMVAQQGFVTVKDRISARPMEELRGLPFIGPVTSWHLAKNLGFDVAKPDRHLERLALHLGFADTHAMCAQVAAVTGQSQAVIDLVLWRFVEQNQGRFRAGLHINTKASGRCCVSSA